MLSLDKRSLEGLKSIIKRCNICFRIQVHWKGKGYKGTQGVDIGRGRGEQIQEEAIFWDFLAFVALSGETVEGQFTSCHHCQHLDLTPTTQVSTVFTKQWSGRSVKHQFGIPVFEVRFECSSEF